MQIRQAIENPHGVSVLGTAILHAVPDFAEIRCAVVQTAAQPPEAFAAARSGASEVQRVLRDLGVFEVRTSRVQIAEARRWDADKRENVRDGFTARIGFHVLVRNLDRTEEILSAVVGAGAGVLEGCVFGTSELAELRRRTRMAAIHAAHEKAEVYAAAAHVGVGAVLHIEDVDPEALRGDEGHVQRAAVEPATGALEPGSIPIRAAVHVTYAIR